MNPPGAWAEKPPSPPGTREPAPEDRLDAWKEIASYLKHGVSSVQRWRKAVEHPFGWLKAVAGVQQVKLKD